MSNQVVADVALPVALAHPLTYAVPPELQADLRVGHRVRVPLRGRKAFGFVLAVRSRSDLPDALSGVKLRAIDRLDPAELLIDGPRLELVRWMAHYYVAPIGMVLETAVPRLIARPPKEKPGEEETPADAVPPGRGSALTLTEAQGRAVARITQAIEAGDGSTFLLQGVTGSGKTEVYLRAADVALARGQGVLFLVPEIALGTQVVRRVRERFGHRVAEYHSQLRPGERRRTWWNVRAGRVRIIVGARSAIFLPVGDLGLIVVDEEHEPSYKQGETPRYHGRDTALMRAHLEGAVTVLGSATPSLESSANADREKYQRLLLPERIDSRPPPTVTLVDLRFTAPGAETAAAETPGPRDLPVVVAGERDPREPLSNHLLDRLRAVLAAGDQAILFLNRRGFSTSVQCRECGHVFECPRCSVVLTHHRSAQELRCHYCNYVLRELEKCPECGGADFTFSGVGTQKVEAALRHHLPQARLLRMDRDSTRRRGSTAAMIEAFEAGEADVLLGTQMVAKGFDFPRVTLVGVINADREMGLPDFRGQERAFQLLTQVAGRAGRGVKPGEVIFQTYIPDHHVITAAGLQDYSLFCEGEMEERRPLGYPPHRRMANVLFDGPDEAAVIRTAFQVADQLGGRPALALLGPAPMPLSRLKGQYRWHLTLISRNARRLTDVLHEIIEQLAPAGGGRRVRVQVDMDPASML